MGWIIAGLIVAGYVAIGMMTVPFIARGRVEFHAQGRMCMFNSECYAHRRGDEASRTCSARYAGVFWFAWPFFLATGLPRGLATGALQRDVEAAKRLKELEKQEAVNKERTAKEMELRRRTDPSKITQADFDKLMEFASKSN